MRWTNAWVGAVAAVALTSLAIQAEPPAASSPAGMYDLANVKGMDEFVGTRAARDKLAANGFVVTEQQFKQIFSAYIAPPLPQFITTDSVWHTYHVLLEEGVRQLEDIQARRLERFARRLVEAAAKRGKSDLLDYYAAVGLGIQDGAYVKGLPKDSPRGGHHRRDCPVAFGNRHADRVPHRRRAVPPQELLHEDPRSADLLHREAVVFAGALPAAKQG